jgi:hypothetical protein
MKYAIAQVTISYAGAEPGKKIFKWVVDPGAWNSLKKLRDNFTFELKKAWTTTNKARAWKVLSDYYNLKNYGNPRVSQRMVYATKIYRVDCSPPVLVED